MKYGPRISLLARAASAILLEVHHDNSHVLHPCYVRWLGADAGPASLRILAVVSGVLSVPLAAGVLWKTGRAEAFVVACLCACSYVLLVYTSEARGYGPMLVFTWATLYF
jgi:hypothetical protein